MQDNVKNNDEIEIDLGEIFGLLLHRLWLIAIVGVVTGVIGFLVSSFAITPKYESTTSVYILNKQNNGNITYSDAQLSEKLSKDYEEMVKSRYVLEEVIKELDLKENYESLAGRVAASNKSDTRIISISVTDTSPTNAQKIANLVRDLSAKHITSVMDVEAVNVVDEANLPTSPVSPSVPKWTLIFAFLGMLIVVAIIIIRFVADDTIKSSDDIEKYLGLSTLALIPLNTKQQPGKSKAKVSSKNVKNTETEFGKELTPSRKIKPVEAVSADGIEFIEEAQ